MKYNLAKLMQEALKKNKKLFNKKAINKDFHFSKSFKKTFRNFKEDEIQKVVCKKMLFMLEKNFQMIKEIPNPEIQNFIKSQIISMLETQNDLFSLQGGGPMKSHEYEEVKQYYPEFTKFDNDDDYFKRYGELVNVVLSHLINHDSFSGETPFVDALELIVDVLEGFIE